MRESKVEAYLRKRVEAAGGLCWKFTSPGLVGVPDRVVILHDPIATIYVETKAPNGRTRSSQKRRHAELRARGKQVYVLWSLEWVDWFMEEVVGAQAHPLANTPLGRLQNA